VDARGWVAVDESAVEKGEVIGRAVRTATGRKTRGLTMGCKAACDCGRGRTCAAARAAELIGGCSILAVQPFPWTGDAAERERIARDEWRRLASGGRAGRDSEEGSTMSTYKTNVAGDAGGSNSRMDPQGVRAALLALLGRPPDDVVDDEQLVRTAIGRPEVRAQVADLVGADLSAGPGELERVLRAALDGVEADEETAARAAARLLLRNSAAARAEFGDDLDAAAAFLRADSEGRAQIFGRDLPEPERLPQTEVGIRARWDADLALQAEFGDFATFAAYCRAEATGFATVCSGTRAGLPSGLRPTAQPRL